MALVNVIRGQELPNAAFHVRTPIVRVPLPLLLSWWLVKGVARLVWFYLRFWPVTVPATAVLYVYGRWGWRGLTYPLLALTAAAGVWWFWHRRSFLRFGWWPVLAQARRVIYRRRWHAAMATAGLTVRFDRHTVVPLLRKVRCRGGVDDVLVRMVTGQIPDDFAKVAERLAHTFGVRQVKAMPGPRPDTVRLVLFRGDPLTKLVAPLPVPGTPDFTGLPVGRQEDGHDFLLRLYGTQVLVVGDTGSGKGSVIWSVIRSVAGGVACGLVELWGVDPKGGMELGIGRPMFARFSGQTPTSMVELVEEAAGIAQARANRLGGHTRQHEPTVADPLILVVIDELAYLTAYMTDRNLTQRVKAALGVLLSQGRAVGVHVLAAIQDPRKDVLPFRNLFPTRVGLRMSEPTQVDMVLGDGFRDRGALCDRIPHTSPGVGYVVLDGDPTPMRVRFSYLDDDGIRAMARTHGRLRVVDSMAVDAEDGAA